MKSPVNGKISQRAKGALMEVIVGFREVVTVLSGNKMLSRKTLKQQ